jgi:hypothetical protein
MAAAASSCAEPSPVPGPGRSPQAESAATTTTTTMAAPASAGYPGNTTTSSDARPPTDNGRPPEKKDPPTETNTLDLSGAPFTPAPFPDSYRYPYGKMQAMTVSNRSDHNITVGSVEVSNPAFTVSGCDGVLLRAAGSRDSCTIVVDFAPVTVGNYEGELRIYVPSDNTVQTKRLYFSYLPPTAGATPPSTSPSVIPIIPSKPSPSK